MKKLVPAMRSSSKSKQAGNSTANASNPMHEVMNHAQVDNRHTHESHALGAQIQSCGDEIQRPEQLPDTKNGDGNDPEILPPAKAGARILSNRAQRSIRRPAGNRRTIGNEEASTRTTKATKVVQNDIILKRGKRHVFRANLDRKEIVAEAGEWRVGEDKKHHERAVHGEKRKIVFGSDNAARRARFCDKLKPGNFRVRPNQVKPHQPGQHHSHKDGCQGERIVLFADHFVIEAEHILLRKPCGGACA